MVGKWMYNVDKTEVWDGDVFDTREEAISEAYKYIDNLIMFKVKSFRIGQIVDSSQVNIDVELILKEIKKCVTKELGEKNNNLNRVSLREKVDLETRVNSVINSWLVDNSLIPEVYELENIEEIRI